MLIKIPTGWEAAEHKILWIGQETAGWSWEREQLRADGLGWEYPDIASLGDFAQYEEAVEALIYGYGEFNFAANHPVSRGPFWRYFRWALETVEAHGPTSMVWTNVVRCSSNSEQGYTLGAVPKAIGSAFLVRQRGLLAAEIEVLRPTLTIFVSGPHYDVYVSNELPGCERVALAPFPIQQAARFTHPTLPSASFRTYHPGYLNRSELGFRPIQAMIDLYLAER
ncbi:hypothetical protein [Methylobacterium sp. SyP6R]|uniref:hypothetical protein n=1 Tax=Methylobacterium sp. SyP6R TaxID=2718876 RepID=UPI001F45DCE3|nr:hypothetical protein [Methylobacterium sp. SyP6R]MCF4127686.1 hypothetical protein [Methylobacterium sp. SyP6R]